jgi:hypothetical protein
MISEAMQILIQHHEKIILKPNKKPTPRLAPKRSDNSSPQSLRYRYTGFKSVDDSLISRKTKASSSSYCGRERNSGLYEARSSILVS